MQASIFTVTDNNIVTHLHIIVALGKSAI